MNIMIDNAVPLNNGDAALIFSLGDELEALGHTITYSTFQLKKVRTRYPNKKWTSSFLSARLINKLPGIRFLYYCLRILCSSVLRKQDLVISAPGGYINSYYGFKTKLLVLSLYKRLLGINIVMFSQSVGPLKESDEKVLQQYLPYFSKFLVRDDISYERIYALIEKEKTIVKTFDAAFLSQPVGYSARLPNQRVAISVRSWTFDNRSQEMYHFLIQGIVEELVDKGFEVVFLSTCQGDEDYVDDSIEANRIYQNLSTELKQSTTIDSNLYTLAELKNELNKFDYVIGTRLHMCILAWLSGVPAFNISYEEKGKECYHYLGLEKYTIDYNENQLNKSKINSFIEMSPAEKKRHFNKIEDIHQDMNKILRRVLDDLISPN
ncbi:polysaccharide pyruvyl transferase family protein [Carnobacterium maltaromaticum]|uniref:polysaccharide pyruvyl transferase family protein n=1 Tax=Carnobacterium maltaromaticum TaxID=2751 RepID=UPI00191BC8FA|nr:polysaccharide pyruvyl transferase family protein [Carnobacterium maltaromaticum]CAD5899713.1 conserved hypothetical protein [Carnobacterium maltaromaticum]